MCAPFPSATTDQWRTTCPMFIICLGPYSGCSICRTDACLQPATHSWTGCECNCLRALKVATSAHQRAQRGLLGGSALAEAADGQMPVVRAENDNKHACMHASWLSGSERKATGWQTHTCTRKMAWLAGVRKSRCRTSRRVSWFTVTTTSPSAACSDSALLRDASASSKGTGPALRCGARSVSTRHMR